MLLNARECSKAVEPEGEDMNTLNTHSGGRRVLLSGASGMVGSALRAALVQRGDRVIQLVRREPAGADELRWDPAAAMPVVQAEALEGFDSVVHLSGANLAARRWTPDYRREIVVSRVESTRAIAGVLAGLRQPPPTFLAASAIGFYGDRRDELVDETASPGSGFLAEMCRSWESATAPAVNAGIRVVNLRFGVALAKHYGALAKMLPIFRTGLAGRLGSGKQWMSWITLDDLVAAVLFVLGSNELAGAVNLTSPQPVTNAEFTRALARVLHRPAVLPAPMFALRLMLGPMADEALMLSTRVAPAKLLSAGFRFAHPQIEDALRSAMGP
jgi:uncharacterized protein (TIGR01777 family)